MGDNSSKKTTKKATKKKKTNKKAETQREFINELFDALNPEKEQEQKAREIIHAWIQSELQKSALSSKYNIIIQYDDSVIHRSDADKIYSAVKSNERNKSILLVLYSRGGDIASAYLISKLCREYTTKEFIVVVPRRAKSAATLICCGADEIHMGSLSELGPIDPQINNLPALGLKNAVHQITELAEEFPKASEMLAEYLNKTVQPIDIGYFNRVVESAAQYAERLLSGQKNKLSKTPQKIANQLVYLYKDHGFVIDKNEAISIFGEKIIKTDSIEYQLGDQLYSLLAFIERICSHFKKTFYYIGNSKDSVRLFNKS